MRTAQILSVLLCLLTGCAALTMQSPKSDDPSEPPRCSESRGGAVVDGLFAVLYGVGGVALLSEGEGGAAVPLLGLGTAHVASAVAGSRSATRCTKAHEAHAEWLKAQRTRPPMDRAEEERASAPAAETSGALGSKCLPDMTCNAGLACDPLLKLCVQPSEQTDASGAATQTAPGPAQPGQPEAAPAPASAPTPPGERGDNEVREPYGDGEAPRTAEQPTTTEPSQPVTQPAPRRPSPTRRRPTRAPTQAPRGDGPWGDFWREVNP